MTGTGAEGEDQRSTIFARPPNGHRRVFLNTTLMPT
jgi:hypothetical protein